MAEKERKTSEEIKEKILSVLSGGPRGISEIAEDINSNWITTEKFLSELIQERKIIEIISASKSKVYASSNDLAFFYLPLSENARNKTLALLTTISNSWKEKTGKFPPRTILQKLAVAFVEANNLQNEIPVLRFHYGQTLALRYEENSDAKQLDLTDVQKDKLDDLITEYKDYSSTIAKNKQYEKPYMKFYREKEIMLVALCDGNFNSIEDSLLNMITHYYPELSESFNLFDRLVYCAVNISHLKNNKEDLLNRLKDVYSLVWDCLTTEAYFYDVQKFIAPNKNEMFSQIKSNYLVSKITNVKNVLDELENEVNSTELEEVGSSDNVSEFVHELLVS